MLLRQGIPHEEGIAASLNAAEGHLVLGGGHEHDALATVAIGARAGRRLLLVLLHAVLKHLRYKVGLLKLELRGQPRHVRLDSGRVNQEAIHRLRIILLVVRGCAVRRRDTTTGHHVRALHHLRRHHHRLLLLGSERVPVDCD